MRRQGVCRHCQVGTLRRRRRVLPATIAITAGAALLLVVFSLLFARPVERWLLGSEPIAQAVEVRELRANARIPPDVARVVAARLTWPEEHEVFDLQLVALIAAVAVLIVGANQRSHVWECSYCDRYFAA